MNQVNTNGAGTNTGTTLGVLGTLTYTGANEPKGWLWADGSAYQRGFDSFGRLSTYPLGKPTGSGAAAGALRTLAYDNATRISGYSHAAVPALNQTFGYDGLDRLNNAVQASTSYGFGYDASGNRSARSIGAGSYANIVSASSNRLSSVQSPSGTVTYSYDAAGNITGDGQASYSYSDRGRMKRATLAGGSVDYLYNGLEQRVSKTGPSALVPGSAAYYAYDEAGHLLGEYDAALVPIYETLYLGDTPVAAVTQARSGPKNNPTVQTGIANVYADHLDTPRVLARNSDQAIVWRWDQAEPFGATPPNENPNGLGVFTFNQRFPGQVFDAETGLFYNWHRDYSAGTGRYVQPDPIGNVLYKDMAVRQLATTALLSPEVLTSLRSTDPAYNHLYGYVGGKPLTRVDPTGLLDPGGGDGGSGGDGGGGECRNIGMVAFPGLFTPVLRTYRVLCVYDCNLTCPGTTKEIKFFWNWSVNEPRCPKSLPRSRFN